MINWIPNNKSFFFIVIAIPALLSSGGRVLDSPTETFYLQPAQIHVAVLKDVIGIITISFNGHPTPHSLPIDTASLAMFEPDSAGKMINVGQLKIRNIAAISGVDYEGILLRRFPVKKRKGVYYQIVYDAKMDRRTWIKMSAPGKILRDKKLNVSGSLLNLQNQKDVLIPVDVFYLMGGNGRRFFLGPDGRARSVAITSEEEMTKIPFRDKGEIGSVYIAEVKNGFAKVMTRAGVDEEPKFAGWIRITEDGSLTLWQVTQPG
jgi:hypothetical protein